jgi:NADPH:quinone reductase-like Zn-dependent oxidoreductase
MSASGGLAQRVMVRGAGGPEVLHVEEARWQAPGPGRVVLAVHAAGVAMGDVMRRRGVLAPPWAYTPGYDVVGEVIAVGPGVDRARLGQRLAGISPSIGFGGYATHVELPERVTVPVPDALTSLDAVAVVLNYITAWQILHRMCGLERGQHVLVHGAAGGVGTAVLDLGRLAGLIVHGTASSPKHGLVRERGGLPIDYRSVDFVESMAATVPEGVHATLDPIGGAHLRRSYATVRPGGTLVAFGLTGDLAKGTLAALAGMGRLVDLWLRPDGRRVSLYGYGSTAKGGLAACVEDLADIYRLQASGAFAPVVGAVVPFAEVRQAHALMDESKHTGKVVLSMA